MLTMHNIQEQGISYHLLIESRINIVDILFELLGSIIVFILTLTLDNFLDCYTCN